jgi:hypothetical protein
MTAVSATSIPPRPAVAVVQPKFPTVSPDGAAMILGCRRDQVLDYVEDGSLQNVFNLAASPVSHRRFIRVLARSVLDFKAGVKSGLSDAAVLALIFPELRQRFSTTEIAWAWACDSGHVHNLIRCGLIKAVPGTGDSVNKSPMIPRPSLTDFLASRRIA